MTLILSEGSSTDEGYRITIPNVSSINPSYTKNTSATPIVSLGVDSAFAIETGSTHTYTFSFMRKHPIDADDTSTDDSKWSNRKWYITLTGIVNRWQFKTNGFRITYIPDGGRGNNPYVPAFENKNGYVKSLTRQFKEGDPTVIHGSISITMGTMYVTTPDPVPLPDRGAIPPEIKVYKSEFQILMSDSNETKWYPLLTGSDTQDSCVTSYTLEGGLEQPFEHLVMKIPKKRLTTVAYELLDDMEPGRNKIILNAVGQCNMTLVKCGKSNSTYTLEAYCDAEVLKGTVLDMDFATSPLDLIETILLSGDYGVKFKKDKTYFCGIQQNLDSDYDIISFKAGTSAWYALQVCAMYLGGRIFFANNNAYLVDYRVNYGDTSDIGWNVKTTYMPVADYRYNINLYEEPDVGITTLHPRIKGDVEYSNEGMDTVSNIQSIICSSTFGTFMRDTEVIYPQSITPSIQTYGQRAGNQINIPELTQYNPDHEYKDETEKKAMEQFNQGSIFAKNFVSYRQEPQQPIIFEVKEMRSDTETHQPMWKPCFFPSSRINALIDTVNDMDINNISAIDGKRTPQLLTLSTFTRHYPEGTTTYEFGVMANVDLSSSTSQILSNVGSIR